MLNKIIKNIKGTHYVNFNSSNPIAFKVSSNEADEVRFKISYVLCFKFLGIYIPVQRGQE